MRYLKPLAWVLLLLGALWAEPLKLPDSQLLEMLNQGREDAAFLKPEQVRILQPQAFPGLTVIGFVVGSNDCLAGQALLEGKLLSLSEACGIVLRSQGWEQAEGAAKIQSALRWLESAQLGFGDTLLRSKPAGFGERGLNFTPPETLATLTGGVRVIGWVESPPDASERRRFRRVLYWFGKDGRIQKSKILEVYELQKS